MTPAPPATAATRLARAAPALVAAALPLLALLASPWRAVVAPGNVAWLARGDAAQHQLGWEFFARQPASLSPRISAWPYPVGTTVGLTDSIPLLALPLRLALGESGVGRQYFGLWVAGCVAALGACGALALRRLGLPPPAAALGGALVGLDPVAWERFERGHYSLCAQALLLATLLAWMRAREDGPPRSLWPFGALTVVASAVHPYLALLVVALWAGAVAFETRRAGWIAWVRHAPVAALSLPAALLAALGSGYLASGATVAVGGFGGYRTDLAALLNPGDRSRVLPPLFGGPTLVEGFVYLGAGVLALGVVALGVAFGERRRRSDPRPAVPAAPAGTLALREIGWTAAALAAIAALPVVSAFGVELLDLRPLPGRIEELFATFRANGRFAWPSRLFVLLAIFRGLAPLGRRPARLVALLAGALALQAVEVPRSAPLRGRDALADEDLDAIREFAGAARHLSLVPVVLADGGGALCGEGEQLSHWERPGRLAARLGWTYDSGLFARLDRTAARAICDRPDLRSPAQSPRSDTIYAVRPRLALRLRRRGSADCRRFAPEIWLCRARQGEAELQ